MKPILESRPFSFIATEDLQLKCSTSHSATLNRKHRVAQ